MIKQKFYRVGKGIHVIGKEILETTREVFGLDVLHNILYQNISVYKYAHKTYKRGEIEFLNIMGDLANTLNKQIEVVNFIGDVAKYIKNDEEKIVVGSDYAIESAIHRAEARAETLFKKAKELDCTIELGNIMKKYHSKKQIGSTFLDDLLENKFIQDRQENFDFTVDKEGAVFFSSNTKNGKKKNGNNYCQRQ